MFLLSSLIPPSLDFFSPFFSAFLSPSPFSLPHNQDDWGTPYPVSEKKNSSIKSGDSTPRETPRDFPSPRYSSIDLSNVGNDLDSPLSPLSIVPPSVSSIFQLLSSCSSSCHLISSQTSRLNNDPLPPPKFVPLTVNLSSVDSLANGEVIHDPTVESLSLDSASLELLFERGLHVFQETAEEVAAVTLSKSEANSLQLLCASSSLPFVSHSFLPLFSPSLSLFRYIKSFSYPQLLMCPR